MSAKDRAKKPSASRTNPIRNSGIFKDPRKANGESAENSAGDPVKQAYLVMEEQMRQGALGALNLFQQQASNFGIPSLGNGLQDAMPNAMGGSSNEIMTQWMNMYTQMLNLGLQSFENFTDMRNGQSDPIPFPGNGSADPTEHVEQPAEQASLVPVIVKLDCKKAAEVQVDLRVPPAARLRAQPLMALNNDEGKITDVMFEAKDDVQVMHIKVPKNAKKGTYVGAVINDVTNAACGTITIRL